jgi:hypothetical protein
MENNISIEKGAEFAHQGNEKAVCSHCSKSINILLLAAHSFLHKYEIQRTDTIVNILPQIPASPELANAIEIVPENVFSIVDKSTSKKKAKCDLLLCIKYYKSFGQSLRKLKKTHKRCVFLQGLKKFRKWKKILIISNN